MDFPDGLQDSLAINLKKQVSILLSTIPGSSASASLLQTSQTRKELLHALSHALLEPSSTTAVAHTFRPLLLDLCARWLERGDYVEEKLAAMSLLLQPHVEIYPVLSHFLYHFLPQSGPLDLVTNSSDPRSLDASRLHRVLLAYYRILQANRELPGHLYWPLEPLSRLMWAPHPDAGVRYLAVRCYSLQSGMGEAERERMEAEVIGSESDTDCPIGYGEDSEGQVKIIDGWLLPIVDAKRIHDARAAIASDPQDFFSENDGNRIDDGELCSFITNVHGVLMFRKPVTTPIMTPLIPTPTSIQALQALALHISLRLPILLTSPPSSGKSLLLSHLAAILHPGVKNQIITIGLADTSLDPRSLLGSYISSSTSPGSFEWKEGIIVRALREGRWLVFEDIDRGSTEVLGTIKPLVESLGMGKWIGGRARIQVPSRGKVLAAESFAFFATRSSSPSRNGVFSKPAFFGAHKFHEIIVTTPSIAELRTILNSRFPTLSGAAAQGIINLWSAIKAIGYTSSSRDVGLRELERYCTRIDKLFPSSYQSMDLTFPADADPSGDGILPVVFPNPTLREDMYVEARDVFFGSGTLTAAAHAHADAIAAVAAEHLSLSREQCDWVLGGRVPDFDSERDVNGRTTALRIGRVRLPARSTQLEMTPAATRPFALHRPAILLMSRIATAISLCEPVLLTGETGTGKTSVVTHMAALLRRHLISLNLSQQTESSDLIGGFKPVDARIPGSELQERFLELFRGTFSQKKNAKFEDSVRKAVQEAKWKRAAGLWRESARLAKDRIQGKMREMAHDDGRTKELDADGPRKRRRTEKAGLSASETDWAAFDEDVQRFEILHVQGKGKLAFSFIEGPLIKALRSGDWILLDEINLASPETLEAVAGLLHGPTASITLTEQGSLEPVPRHPDFRLFACMNPATDVGKKDLPPNIRSHFTEIDVPPPDADRDTLLSIVTQYIGPSALGDKAAIMDVAEFYTTVKKLAGARQIADGSNHRPHFSMRTLARALTFAADIASTYSLRRALWEGCLMAFTMVLDAPSAEVVTALAQKHILAGVRNVRSLLARDPNPPQSRPVEEFVKLGPFYLEKGPLPDDAVDDYIMTPSVERKLIDLARIIVTRRFPVLIEGPTSSGKTSSIEYLAKTTGHRFVRINNHEHTDIQEYLGTYVSDPVTGKLVFKDGLLVQALRNGDWIVLDELNLAPTDVLEALNRLLDDNRELVIPETQEVVTPHPHFLLFATQNPPGLYAGRKVLSRAFRNRFLEVHFEDVPQAELETILCQRCRIAPSYAQRIVSVFRELQKRRQSSRVFESKHGFATLRDLFRWAGRDAVGYQELAENGYMLLAERARCADDKVVVKEIIESTMKVHIDESTLYDFHRIENEFATILGFDIPSSSSLVWTKAMQRLVVLVGRALRFNEPVLLVGETGTGKTSICQVYADAVGKRLYPLSCHQNTETADLVGGLRPVRNRTSQEAEVFGEAASLLSQHGLHDVPLDAASLKSTLDRLAKSSSALLDQVQYIQGKLQRLGAIFEWYDGPLVEAMRQGDVLLLDEISLADDSVLERLNSVLEPARTIVLAEKGGDSPADSHIQAAPGFKLISTMNPGGDYGKKELSPSLRNRFTEIWVPSVDDRKDLEHIVASSWRHDGLKPYTQPLLDFCDWLSTRVSEPHLLGLRDILSWVTFSNSVLDSEVLRDMPLNEIFHHAAHMTCLDGLSSLPPLISYSADTIRSLKVEALAKLREFAPTNPDEAAFYVPSHHSSRFVQLGIFAIPRGPREQLMHTYNIQAPTTRDNAMRVIRACQLYKPILLEGSPGVGKTSLITALANICGYPLCRINLSDQTDLADLFGSDLPVEGGGPGEFVWKDAEFLKAMQEGHWVLLDEMNLAPQSVLEGLNAVLDHRGSVYVPELGRSFTRHPSFRIFAAQNPIQQGGGRKGLPKSYVNRFTKVYVDPLTPSDLLQITRHMFPDYPIEWLQNMITYNALLEDLIVTKHNFGRSGGPWEFNLRDLVRWASLLRTAARPLHPIEHLRNIYLARFRTITDKTAAQTLFNSTFNTSGPPLDSSPYPSVSPNHVQVGHFLYSRANYASLSRPGVLLQAHLPLIESFGVALNQGGLVILTGQHNSGKTSLVRFMADLTGNALHEISINNATDTMDILGSFEQVDDMGRANILIQRVVSLVDRISRSVRGSRWRSSTELTELRRVAGTMASTPFHSSALEAASSVLNELDAVDDRWIEERHDLRRQISRALSAPRSVGRFEWVDGPLVRALKSGTWLLLDGANLCSPSVLDRLNALCEPSGVLTLNERGLVDGAVQVIVPHPTFRLIMCVDPQYGELSRAMRNRGLEVYVSADWGANDAHRIHEYLHLPPSSASSRIKPESLLQFELQRRGLYPFSPHQADPIWPCARLTEDSSSSTVMNLAAVLLPSQPLSSLETALPIFAARSVVPAYVNRLSRLLSRWNSLQPSTQMQTLCEVVEMMKQDPAWDKLGYLRQPFGQIWPVSSDFLRVQPMDFFMKAMSLSHSYPELDRPSVQWPILRVLEIFVRIYVQDHPEKSSMNVQIDDDPNDLSSRVLKSVDDILLLLQQQGPLMLGRLPHALDDNHDVLAEIEVVLKLQKFARPLLDLDRGAVDFSTAQAVSKWILDALQDSPPQFSEINHLVEVLSRLVTPSSGSGLMDIWSSMSKHLLAIAPVDLLPMETVAFSPTNDSHAYKLRSQVMNVMAIHTLPPTSMDQAAQHDVEQMAQSLHKLLPGDISIAQHSLPLSTLKDDTLSVLKELDAISNLQSSNTGFRQSIENIINLACRSPRIPLRRFISYQHAVWSIEANQFDMTSLSSVHKSWLQALWNLDGTDGASAILEPTELHHTHLKSDWNAVTLDSLNLYEATLEQHMSVFFMGCETEASRVQGLILVYRQALLILTSSFADHFDDESRQEFQSACRNPAATPLVQILALLERTTHPALSLSVRRYLTPVAAELEVSLSEPSAIRALGQGWIALFHLFVDLYIPNTPVDPAAMQNCTWDFWESERMNLFNQLQLHTELERLTTGNTSNGIVRYLETEVQKAQQALNGHTSVRPGLQRTVGRLREYWSEISQFLAKVVAPSRLDPLLALLASQDSAAPVREHVVQESLAGFSQRLDTLYGDFADISTPLQSALLHLRLGLRLVAHASASGSSVDISTAADMLVAFPTVRGTASLLTTLSVNTPFAAGSAAFDYLLLKLAAIVLEIDLGVNIQTLTTNVDLIYEQASRLWLIDVSRQEEADKASQTLYRSHHVESEAINDSEVEEAEFLSLFPDFEASFESSEDSVPGSSRRDPSLVESSHVTCLVGLHFHLLGPRIASTSGMQQSVEHFVHYRDSMMRSILEDHVGVLGERLDQRSFVHQLSLLHRRQSHLRHQIPPSSRPYNFYLDSNVPEVRKASSLVLSIKHRLESIIEQWPDQMVLHHLKERCDQILRLNVHSPVAKILTVLEQLLLQSEDWEMYANRENSLKDLRQSLTTLIVDWRQLELSSWKGLLQTQAIAFEEDASDWWFRLYNALVRGMLDVVDHDAEGVEGYLDKLVPLVDDFVQTSPVGQYQRRITLLKSFVTFLQHLARTKIGIPREALERVLRILHATVSYYTQFTPRVSASLSSQRDVVEKDIKGFIKLASWRDINVQALKASAQRTHRQLYKSIRKFREALRQPVKSLLQAEHANESEVEVTLKHHDPRQVGSSDTDPNGALGIPVLSDSPMAVTHLRDLPRTYKRYDFIIGGRIESFIKSRPTESVHEFAVEIISTAKALSTIPLPGDVTAERREKLWKSLLSRKRKAWSDFLKEMKRVGFSANVKPETLIQQRSDRWTREQPILGNRTSADVNKVDHYFQRLQGLFPQLRAALSDHHSDLSTRELQRGVMFLESGLSVALDVRSSLASGLDSYDELKGLSDRLNSLNGNQRIVASGSHMLQRVVRTKDLLSRLSHAISETAEALRIYATFMSARPIPDAFVEEVQSLLMLTNSHRDGLIAVIVKAASTGIPILLEDEQTVVSAGHAHIVEVSRLLPQWEELHPHLKRVIKPVHEWLVSESADISVKLTVGSSDLDTDRSIDALLVTVQSVMAALPDEQGMDQISSQDNYLRDTSRIFTQLRRLLNMDDLAAKLNDVVKSLAACSAEATQRNISRLLPFVQRYMALAETYLSSVTQWAIGLFKLEFIACSVILTVATQGFCKPPDVEESGNGEGGEAVGGMGLGEGTGHENVSKEIEDESQVEGLKGEDGEANKEKNQNDDDDAIEMGDDFEGDMADVPDDGSEEEQKSDEEGDDEGPEDQLGDVDAADPSAVDEKLWGDEKGPESDADQGKTNEDRSTEAKKDSEVVAKEKEGSNSQNDQAQKQPSDEKDHDPADEPMPEDDIDEEAGQDAPDGAGAPMDDFVQDSNTPLDLPDELDLGPEEEAQDEQAGASDEDDDMLGEDEQGPLTGEPDGADDRQRPGSSPEPVDEKANDLDSQAQQHGGEDDEAALEGDQSAEDAVAEPDIRPGDATSNEAVPEQTFNSNVHDESGSGNSGKTDGGGVMPSGTGVESEHDDGATREAEEKATAPDDLEGYGSNSTGVQRGSAPSQESVQRPLSSNPLRSLGDTMKELHQRFDDILEGDDTQDQPAPQTADVAESSQLEYLRPDDADQDIQALGPAGAEQVAKLSELELINDERLAEDGLNSMDIDHPEPTEALPAQTNPLTAPVSSETMQGDIESALTQTQIRLQGTDQNAESILDPEASKAKVDTETPESEGTVEAALRHWQRQGQPMDGAEQLWRQYESLTHDLSYALSEQLRLILEPTLATRLKGDYRTGKRLNMKKIIPYIASEYAKDKIWLRRTRPSQREYQVLIALDDSRSMAESHSVHLAYQTLALVTKALSRLEVGDVGVAKFGEGVDVLHGFDEGPFTDHAGTQVMHAFGFNQRATNVHSLVESSLKLLEEARERRSLSSSSAADLWQLEIIISDGICQDHEKLRTVLRRAEEQRVMVVFVIIDSLHSNAAAAGSTSTATGPMQNSILSMNQVAYKNVDGRMELQMQRYLDSFPFEYYVVLRSVEALPEVLSGTLKQFFERISDE